jgi:hypothetical protein
MLWPLHWVLLLLPILAMAGGGLAWLAGYQFDVDVVLYAFFIKYGVLATIALLALVSVTPLTLAVWWLRTPNEDRPRHMLLWLLEHGCMGVLVIGSPGLALLHRARCSLDHEARPMGATSARSRPRVGDRRAHCVGRICLPYPSGVGRPQVIPRHYMASRLRGARSARRRFLF